MKALKFTFTPLMIFAKKHPMCTDCKNGLNEFQNGIETLIPQNSHQDIPIRTKDIEFIEMTDPQLRITVVSTSSTSRILII